MQWNIYIESSLHASNLEYDIERVACFCPTLWSPFDDRGLRFYFLLSKLCFYSDAPNQIVRASWRWVKVLRTTVGIGTTRSRAYCQMCDYCEYNGKF